MDNEKLAKVFEKFDHKELANKCVEMSIELLTLKDEIKDKVRILIKEKLEDIIDELNIIKENSNLEHINICQHQYNAMKQVLEELLQELDGAE